jgi:predicted kinase
MHSNTMDTDETAKDLHVLDVPLSERWHRINMRNAQGVSGAVPIRRDQLTEWDPYFEAPTSDELALSDPL